MSRIAPIRNTIAARFAQDRAGMIAPVFALALVPILFATGAAVDYTRASNELAKLQAALDAAVLAGAKDGTANWIATASNVFTARFGSAGGASTTFSLSSGKYNGTASASVSTAFVKIAGYQDIPIRVSATAVAGSTDTSCILALGKGEALTNDSLTFNGAPNVALTGCSIRSNTSLRCNGHSTGAKASIAAGSASGCSNPQSNAPVVQDIHAALASNITKKCSAQPGVTWSPGSVPTSSAVIAVSNASYNEYHVCGDLTLSGSGALTGSAPSSDTVIVIENGRLIMDDRASIQANRVTFVLTGDNTKASSIEFPNGTGKAATLSISPSTGSTTPWRGVSVYQDPSLTTSVDHDWGPGATFNLDGVVYLPNADVRMHGNPSSNNPACAKLIVDTLTSNGSVNLNQTTQGCSSLGVQQWTESVARLIN